MAMPRQFTPWITTGKLRKWLFIVALHLIAPFCQAQAQAQEMSVRARVFIDNVPTDPNIVGEVYIQWAAEDPSRPLNSLQTVPFETAGGRSTGKVSVWSEVRKIRTSTDFLVFGVIKDALTDEPLGYLPLQKSNIGSHSSPTQIELTVSMVKSAQVAVDGSFPISSNPGGDFLESSNFRTALLGLKHIVQNYVPKADRGWDSIYYFFSKNRDFFRSGSSAELTDAFTYLSDFQRTTADPTFPTFYAEFLNELITDKDARKVLGDQTFDEFILDQLAANYRKSMEESLNSADLSLEKLFKLKDYRRCIDLSKVIFGAITHDMVISGKYQKNIFSVIVNFSVCAQKFYAEEEGGSKNNLTEGGKFLRMHDETAPAMEAFAELGRILVENGLISLQSKGKPGEVAKIYANYVN